MRKKVYLSVLEPAQSTTLRPVVNRMESRCLISTKRNADVKEY